MALKPNPAPLLNAQEVTRKRCTRMLFTIHLPPALFFLAWVAPFWPLPARLHFLASLYLSTIPRFFLTFIIGLVASEQTGALLGLDMAIRFFQRRICLTIILFTSPCQLCHPCIGAFRRRYCYLSFERILVRIWRSDRKLVPCVWSCRSRQGTGCNVIIRSSCVDHDHCVLPTSYKITERVFLR